MAKQRMINTKFWSDGWIVNLDPIEKLLFLYLLTNERTNICGVYELPIKYMAIETGIDKDMVEKVLKRFTKDKKIYFIKGWVVIKNFIKNQNQGSPKVKVGIEAELSKIPAEILTKIKELDTLSKGIDTLSHLNLNLNLNSNLNLNNSVEPQVVKKKEINKNNPISLIVDFFYKVNNWPLPVNPAEQKLYRRWLRPAKELLELCEGNIDEAKTCIKKVGEWATSRQLSWGIETIFKQWYNLDFLKPKEKKPYYDGKRIFQKSDGGRYYVVSRDGDIKELGISPKKEEIIWK
jgi:hypothetical protein